MSVELTMRNPIVALVALVTALVLPMSPAAAAYPESIPLPDGFYPEGIEIGAGADFYVGSLLDGAVYKGDLRTGDGAVLVDGAAGRSIAALSFDRRSGLLWAVGSQHGVTTVYAFDGRSGALAHQVPVDGGSLNDLVVTRDALYITDSLRDELWTLPLTRRGAPADLPQPLTLSGDFAYVTGGGQSLNLNGIAATADGRSLIAVHTTLGALYHIDPATGEATQIDLGSDAVPSGDDMVLRGTTVFVVQHLLNAVAVVELAPALTSGRVVDRITSARFRVPTAAALVDDHLYLVNARFDEAPPPSPGEPVSVAYEVVKVPAR